MLPAEVGNRDHVELLARVGDIEVVAKESQREGARFEGEFAEVHLADGGDHAQRHPVDVDRVALLEGAHDEGHEVAST